MTGGTAADYFEAVHGVFDNILPGWETKVVGIATDGASVMRGYRTGLVVWLQKDIEGLVAVHCVAHDLQLATMDASKDLEYLTRDFDPTLKVLFNHYHYSPKRQRTLEEIAAQIGQQPGELKKLTQWKNLRWAACEEQLIEVVQDDWPSIVTHLREEAEAKTAEGAIQGKMCGNFNTFFSHYV